MLLASSTFAAANTNTLTGTVGPGFTITMNKKTVKAGTYVITIHDLASIHDFHLTGPGVDKKTSVTGTGTTKWTVKLKKGTTLATIIGCAELAIHLHLTEALYRTRTDDPFLTMGATGRLDLIHWSQHGLSIRARRGRGQSKPGLSADNAR